VTSGRLLVTSQESDELLLYGPDGIEIKRLFLPDLNEIGHAVETSRGTFIVLHHSKPRRVSEVCEIDANGLVIRLCSNKFREAVHMTLDSDGRVLLVDHPRVAVLLLNSRLELERILLGTEDQLGFFPRRVCHVPQTGRTFIGCSLNYVQAFDWSRIEHR